MTPAAVAPDGFGARLAAAVAQRASQVVLGLDPDPRRVPGGAEGARAFCRRAIAAAGPACVAAKLQLASFERFGTAGWEAFERVAAAAADAGLLVIADAKRGDVDVTSRAYAEAFLRPPIDALTINPSLGGDAVAPFVEAAAASGRGLFALVRTSNPGAAELQDLPLASGGLWHEEVARLVAGWGAPSVDSSGLSCLGAVVGATVPGRMAALRELMPHQPLLIPGVGAQGGRPEDLGPAFGGRAAGALVSASRSIIFAESPRRAAEELRTALWSAFESS
ncbi:orotidine-5'-phosphate decarboxylase [Miltoncostaea oceani]|uniref:orotidine-5'-phosphate decarboxylase n=1 Tax=Miltoncostaea oceani TaxID=2843216 RepID=UPI001C3D2AD1|nr:orotidine-5'-phosphate decarboxylase [Miltoncostaea oceani]